MSNDKPKIIVIDESNHYGHVEHDAASRLSPWRVRKAADRVTDNFYHSLSEPRPWHYVFFKGFKWYRRLTKGLWQRIDGSCWIRVHVRFNVPNVITEDWRPQ